MFGKDRAISVPYDPEFIRTKAHYSDLYFGASLKALVLLGESKGYSFIGCNSAGNNAYFVKNQSMKDLKKRNIEDGYIPSRFRECRDKQHQLTYTSGIERINVLKGLKIVNTENGQIEYL